MKKFKLNNNIFMLNVTTNEMNYEKAGKIVLPKEHKNHCCIISDGNTTYRITEDMFKIFFSVLKYD